MKISKSLPTKAVLIQNALLTYWKMSGRKDLPWRRTQDPWKILLTEVLLRKTTSGQAVRVYDVISVLSPEQICSMPESELHGILKPLGLYRVRAAQLKKTAAAVEKAGTNALQDPEFLESLPGIGRYIRNAVLCFGYGLPKPALDTNMIRVIQRVYDYKLERSRAREDKKLWQFAETLVPKKKCREYNWAVLDLAAAICTARNPKCSECPLLPLCCFGSKEI
jgi:A/G-specific adenine glycosylase